MAIFLKKSLLKSLQQTSCASFSVETTSVLAGHLPPKVIKLIQEWAKTHKSELKENWSRIQNHEPIKYINGADKD
jgi:hypothetical protein